MQQPVAHATAGDQLALVASGDSISSAIEQETLLPEAYNYPSVTFWAALSAVLPEAVHGVELRKKQRSGYLSRLVSFVNSEAFLLRARRIFLWISSLSIAWVFLAVLSWRGRAAEALVAASVAHCTLPHPLLAPPSSGTRFPSRLPGRG